MLYTESCAGCSPQKPVSVDTLGKVQAQHASRKFGRALAAHLELVQSTIISEHEASLRELQLENRNLRIKLQAVDSAVNGPESPTFGILSEAEPKDGGRRAHTSDANVMQPSRSLQMSNYGGSSPGMPVASTTEAKTVAEELLSSGLSKALEELRNDMVGMRQELQEVASSVCTEVRLATSELPTRVAALENVDDQPHEHQEALAANNSSEQNQVVVPTENPPPQYSSDSQVRKNVSFRGAPDPSQWNCLQRIVFSNTFELMSGALIFLNTVVMALELQYAGFDAGHDLRVNEYRSSKSTWPGAEHLFNISNIAFNVLFFLELLARYAAMGLKSALRSPWIWFDTCIVTLGLADFVANEIRDGGLGMDPTMIRVVRLVRLVRMLKVFKSMSAFDSLFLLIKSINASLNALLWSFLLLVTVQMTTGMFICQLLNSYIVDGNQDHKKRVEVFKYFGTFTRTMLTMFEITLANWVPSCRALLEHVSEYYMIFYIVYRCMFCFAVLKVIAAVFITETNRVLQNDDELTVLKTRREKTRYMKKLQTLFAQMDMGQDGELDLDDVQHLMTDDYMVTWLATLGFEGHDFEKIFQQGAKEPGGKLSLHNFLDKVVKAKGQAKTIDILKILHQVEETNNRVFNLSRQFNQAQEENKHSLALLQSRVHG